VPGFITDACGLLLLFPPTRALARRFFKRRLRVYTFGTFPRDRRPDSGPGAPGAGPRIGPDDVIDV
jgi:UPF0716 family protein affecting phage T7 exclusion